MGRPLTNLRQTALADICRYHSRRNFRLWPSLPSLSEGAHKGPRRPPFRNILRPRRQNYIKISPLAMYLVLVSKQCAVLHRSSHMAGDQSTLPSCDGFCLVATVVERMDRLDRADLQKQTDMAASLPLPDAPASAIYTANRNCWRRGRVLSRNC